VRVGLGKVAALVGLVTKSRLGGPCFLVWGCNMRIRAEYIVNDLKHVPHAQFLTICSDGLSPNKGGTKESASISEIVRVVQVESFTI
jgi:hypothetical protein